MPIADIAGDTFFLAYCARVSDRHRSIWKIGLDPTVRTKQGLTEGFKEEEIFKFLGVPYAEPPVRSTHATTI